MLLPAAGFPQWGVTVRILTDPAVASRAATVPSHTTLIATIATAGILVLLFAVIAEPLAAAIAGPSEGDDRGPFRAGLALALGLLGVAAGVSLAVGG